MQMQSLWLWSRPVRGHQALPPCGCVVQLRNLHSPVRMNERCARNNAWRVSAWLHVSGFEHLSVCCVMNGSMYKNVFCLVWYVWGDYRVWVGHDWIACVFNSSFTWRLWISLFICCILCTIICMYNERGRESREPREKQINSTVGKQHGPSHDARVLDMHLSGAPHTAHFTGMNRNELYQSTSV